MLALFHDKQGHLQSVYKCPARHVLRATMHPCVGTSVLLSLPQRHDEVTPPLSARLQAKLPRASFDLLLARAATQHSIDRTEGR